MGTRYFLSTASSSLGALQNILINGHCREIKDLLESNIPTRFKKKKKKENIFGDSKKSVATILFSHHFARVTFSVSLFFFDPSTLISAAHCFTINVVTQDAWKTTRRRMPDNVGANVYAAFKSLHIKVQSSMFPH